MVAAANRDPLCIPTSIFQLFCSVAVARFQPNTAAPDESLAEWPRMKRLPCEFEWGCQRMQRLVTEITDEARHRLLNTTIFMPWKKKSDQSCVYNGFLAQPF